MKHKNAPRAIPESDPEIKELLERAKKMHKKLQEQIAELEAYGDKIPDVYRFFLKELNPNRIGNRLFREKYEKQKELLIQKLKTALGTGKIDELLQKEGMQKTSSGLRRHRLHGRQGWIRIE